MRFRRGSSFLVTAIATVVVLVLCAAGAQAAVLLPDVCQNRVDASTSISVFQNGLGINAVLDLMNTISNNLFTASSQAGVYLATALGTIEVAWFTVQSVVFKQRVDEMIKDLFFKVLTVLTMIALIEGLAGNSGALVKSFTFGLFTQFANVATSGLTNTQYSVNPNADAMKSASVNILADGAQAAAAVENCPASLYYKTHSFNSPNIVADTQTGIETLVSLPDRLQDVVLGGVIMLLYAGIDIILIGTMIDGLIVLSAGIFVLGFANSRWTSDNASSYFRLMFSVGFKIFAYTFVANLGIVLIDAAVSTALVTSMQVNLDLPALSEIGRLTVVVALTFTGFLLFQAGNISKALSQGTFGVGMAGGALKFAGEIAGYGAAAVVTGGAAAAGAYRGAQAAGNGVASGAASTASAMSGAGAAGPTSGSGGGGGGNGGGGGGSGSSRLPDLTRAIKSGGQRSTSHIDHDVSSSGINFRPH